MHAYRSFQVGTVFFALNVACISDYPYADSVGGSEASSSSSSPTTGTTPGSDCGNAMVEPGEDCDDGKSNNGPGKACLADCAKNVCGDSDKGPGEGCDDGNKVETDGCLNNCTPAGCGDGKVQAGEGCDDGNKVETDACLNDCTPAGCGDGFMQGDEQCDLGSDNKDTGECTALCKSAICGDGFVWEEKEDCDLGAGNNGDEKACKEDCSNNVCGDGNVGPGEECDAGEKNADDGYCTLQCKNAICGDSLVQIGKEECDDGNDVDTGDGCPNSCFFDRHVFLTSQLYCGNLNLFNDGGCDGEALEGMLSGVARGDARCNKLQTPKSGFTYRAWLSDGAASPVSRFTAKTEMFSGRYVLLNETLVANGWLGLVSGAIAPISRTDKGVSLVKASVWTNTKSDGNPTAGEHCGNWSVSDVGKTADYGAIEGAGATWSLTGKSACSFPLRLYCIEDRL